MERQLTNIPNETSTITIDSSFLWKDKDDAELAHSFILCNDKVTEYRPMLSQLTPSMTVIIRPQITIHNILDVVARNGGS